MDGNINDSTFGQVTGTAGTPTSPYGTFLGFDSSPRIVQMTGKSYRLRNQKAAGEETEDSKPAIPPTGPEENGNGSKPAIPPTGPRRKSTGSKPAISPTGPEVENEGEEDR